MHGIGYLNRTWAKIALIYLFIVALLGVLMRFMLVQPIEGLNFKYILHAHSHTALLGWVYSALYVILLAAFLPASSAAHKKYKWLFWLTQVSVVGMLLSFPVQGYAAVSITFSTLHILFSYAFIYFFLKDLKRSGMAQTNPVSTNFIKASLLFLAISSIGPFSLAPIMVNGLGGSQLYYLAIYFYLHFQYNGWFTFALFGILFRWWETSGIAYSNVRGRLFFRMLFWACIPAYALSALWIEPPSWVYLIGGMAAALQLTALMHFIQSFKHIWHSRKLKMPLIVKQLIHLSFIAFAIKISLQLGSALPELARLAYVIREFIIGYLHIVLLGFVSLFLFAWLISKGIWQANTKMAKSGLAIFIISFVLSEALLFLQGFLYWQASWTMPHYNMVLFIVTIFMPAGIGAFLFSQLAKHAKSHLQT